MPKAIGVTSVIDASGMEAGDCNAHAIELEVIRCSWDTSHDLIYKWIMPETGVSKHCDSTFCGMK